MKLFMARFALIAGVAVVFCTAPLAAQTTYSLNVGGANSNLGPCTGNAPPFGTVLNSNTPVAATVHCGPGGGSIDATAYANPGAIGGSAVTSASFGGDGGSTVGFTTHVVFSRIGDPAATGPIPVALNMNVASMMSAAGSANGGWDVTMGIANTNFTISTSVDSSGSVTQQGGSLFFSSGGESPSFAAETVSGVLTTPSLPGIPLNVPVFIIVRYNTSGFGNPGTFQSSFSMSCPMASDVFTLPAGFTANAPDISLVDNRCVPPILYSWGGNGSGQLGNGNTTGDTIAPAPVLGPGGTGNLPGVIAVAGGGSHSLALTSTGAVYAWGDNSAGQLGVGSGTPSSTTPIQVPLPGGRAFAIAAGENHSMALMDDGTIYSWGSNLNGQPNDGGASPDVFTPVKVMDASGVAPLSRIDAIAAGNHFSVALAHDSTVYTWGTNDRGQLGNGTATDHVSLPAQVLGVGGTGILGSVTAISASQLANHVVVLTDAPAAFAWGENLDGELGDGLTGVFSPVPVQVMNPQGTGFLTGSIAAVSGGAHSLSLQNGGGAVYAWGNNAQDQLGINSTTGQPLPVQVLGPGANGTLSGITAIQPGGFHSLATDPAGDLFAWGASTHGQLGNASTSSGTGATPVQVLGPGGVGSLQGVSAFAAGESHSLAVSTSIPATTTPDLTITKTHSGNFTQGQQGAAYTITVTNAGDGPAVGTVTVGETLPAGLTGLSMAGAGWSCTLLTCSSSATLAPGASYPPITVTVNVDANAPASLTNIATVSGGGEVNTDNDSASDPTTIAPGVPDLAIIKTHIGDFTQGQSGVTYSIRVDNILGAGPTVGTITVIDTLPAGLTATAMTGPGWACTLASLTCTRSDSLAVGGLSSLITLTADVAANAGPSVTNTATVSGGGEVNTANDSASDPTTIAPGVPDLTIAKTHSGNFTAGQTGAVYTILVTNAGAGPTAGTVTVNDLLPGALNPTSITGTGWSCNLNTPSVPACTRSDALAPGSSYPAITLTVSVAAGTSASFINTATVSGGGEVNTANDSASDPTTLAQVPDLSILSTHSGSFTAGQTGAAYTIRVSNVQGNAATTGTVTVIDTLPAALTATAMTGSGWSCTLANLTCTRGDALAAGGTYPLITLTADVALNAPANVVNLATVSGGGEVNTANDSAGDPTTIAPGVPDLTIAKTHSGNFTAGQTGAVYTILVTNAGAGPRLVRSLSTTCCPGL